MDGEAEVCCDWVDLVDDGCDGGAWGGVEEVLCGVVHGAGGGVGNIEFGVNGEGFWS